MNIILIFIIAVSLSMDAFSLALIYGTQHISNRNKILLLIAFAVITLSYRVNLIIP